MTRNQSCVTAGLAFVILEIALIAWIDRPLSEYLRSLDAEHHSLINIFRAYTDLGKSVWYLWPSGIGIIACALYLRLSKAAQAKRRNIVRIGRDLLFFFACIAVSGIATDIVKPILSRARPVMLEREGLYGFHPLSFHTTWNSMPSGHATTALALAFCLTALFPRYRIAFFAFGIVLAISRIMVNAHYLSDVLAGGMIGTLTVYLLRHVFTSNGINRFINVIFPIDGKSARM